ncbi:pseudouridine synthase [Thalassotalea piscium]|uniref:tRNA pseudouridine32 synthase/23S rRNA pseudouridine746 synthase n=1 Tax=Thalassotalea piscium TaxID=1230533 RepID=A0A7X0NJF2_9GAMM|nr:pseudouridine synthase [Thalassotalea piscium]MBB6544525.1 tRNA pseudouridine32 synthase/23S rRNA pseudouridine746 synthase [Thalassotalea piscium]
MTLFNDAPCFTEFKHAIEGFALPKRFTFPFYYQPHPLCQLAAKELQRYLDEQTQWQHNFGLTGNTEDATGKMFGVLIVKKSDNTIGYLSAFSGKLADKNVHQHFVPPVFDMLIKEDFFLTEQQAINKINDDLDSRLRNEAYTETKQLLSRYLTESVNEITQLQHSNAEQKKQRKAKRTSAKVTLSEHNFNALNEQLNKESVANKNSLNALKAQWKSQIEQLEQALLVHNNAIDKLKLTRKKRSNALQKKLFEHYQFLNIKGAKKDLNTIFKDSVHPPPAGAGECAAPKLLHYAFANNLTPLAMAEFWWGVSPKSEIRQHGNFYPACIGKCQPILTHMLEGMAIDNNPLLENPAAGKTLAIIYQDTHIVVVNKPAEFLSVPGKHINDSVLTRIEQLFPQATGGIIVHRLDMSTSGLMVLALNPRAHKGLQKQFIKREVSKRYIAVISGKVNSTEGKITLPLRGDLNDRPRQLVCNELGKKAETTWQLISQSDKVSRVYLYPKTGRTHQLRVHCAHSDGLNSPIVGDDLYGKKANRLHLHAQQLAFCHPITKAPLTFECEPDF